MTYIGNGVTTLPKTLNHFMGFVVGVIFMFIPEVHIFILSDILNSISGGDVIDHPLQSILNTLRLFFAIIFGFKIIKSAL